ncbi:MAG: hypothetical protein LIP16_22230 [Clostridium sp.]|nr:hypothetical protein [Clostridium sp.]
MKKRGRPTKEKRSTDLHIRLTPAEKEFLEQFANESGLSKTQAVIQGVQQLKNVLEAEKAALLTKKEQEM